MCMCLCVCVCVSVWLFVEGALLGMMQRAPKALAMVVSVLSNTWLQWGAILALLLGVVVMQAKLKQTNAYARLTKRELEMSRRLLVHKDGPAYGRLSIEGETSLLTLSPSSSQPILPQKHQLFPALKTSLHVSSVSTCAQRTSALIYTEKPQLPRRSHTQPWEDVLPQRERTAEK